MTAQLSGRMRRFRIRVIPGDRVQVGLSPYDPTHGFITFRLREGEQTDGPVSALREQARRRCCSARSSAADRLRLRVAALAPHPGLEIHPVREQQPRAWRATRSGPARGCASGRAW